MTNLDSVLKIRGITLPTKVCLVKAMVFPIVMYRCKSWTKKKAECWRIDAFELWCWRRLLRVSWTARRSNQSILKESNPEYSLKGLRLQLQCFGHLMWRAGTLGKTLMLGKIRAGGEGAPEDEMAGWHHLLNGHEFEQTLGNGEGQVILVCCSSWGSQRIRHDLMSEQQNIPQGKGWSEFHNSKVTKEVETLFTDITFQYSKTFF